MTVCLTKCDAVWTRNRAKAVASMIVALLAIAAVYRIARYVMAFPLWGDEAFVAVNLFDRSYGQLFAPLEYGQIVPLGYIWATKACFEWLGSGELSLRAPAFVSGLTGLVVFWRFGRSVLDARSFLMALGIFAASYYVVRHSAEVKPYATDLAVAVVVTALGWKVHRRKSDPFAWLALVVASTVGVWCSYPAIFVCGAVGFLLLGDVVVAFAGRARHAHRGAVRQAASLLVYGVLTCGGFGVMYVTYARPHAQAASNVTSFKIDTWQDARPPTDKPWMIPLWLLDVHTGNLLAYPIGGKNGGSTVTFVLVLVGSISLWRQRRRDLLWLLLGPLPLMLAASCLKLYPYGTSARVAQHMAPAFCLLAGVGLAGVIRRFLDARMQGRGLVIATGVWTLLAGGGAVHCVVRPYKEGPDFENRRVMQTLAAQSRPGDQWVVYNSLRPTPWARDKFVSLGGSGARFRYYTMRYAPGQVHWSPRPDDFQAHGTVWLLAYHDNEQALSSDQFARYVADMSHRLGKPRDHFMFELGRSKGPVEAVEAYVY